MLQFSQVKNGRWHRTRPLVLQKKVRREWVCHDGWANVPPVCVAGRWHSRASRPRFLLPDDETFVGRSRQASFTQAAGNNIVPAFGCVRSHISDRSIRNRPQCGTINPWPRRQICAVTAERGTINQTWREKPVLTPSLLGRYHPLGPSLRHARCATALSHNHWRCRADVMGLAASKCVFLPQWIEHLKRVQYLGPLATLFHFKPNTGHSSTLMLFFLSEVLKIFYTARQA